MKTFYKKYKKLISVGSAIGLFTFLLVFCFNIFFKSYYLSFLTMSFFGFFYFLVSTIISTSVIRARRFGNLVKGKKQSKLNSEILIISLSCFVAFYFFDLLIHIIQSFLTMYLSDNLLSVEIQSKGYEIKYEIFNSLCIKNSMIYFFSLILSIFVSKIDLQRLKY